MASRRIPRPSYHLQRCSSVLGRCFVTIAFLAGIVACNDEIVIEGKQVGWTLTSSTLTVFAGGKRHRELKVEPGKPGSLRGGEEVFIDGKAYVAGDKGGIVSIRDGKHFLTGMRERR